MLTLLAAVLAMPARAPAQTRNWTVSTAAQLLDYVRHLSDQGLDPADYEPEALARALTRQDAPALETAATRSFALIARDLANGHLPLGDPRRSHLNERNLAPESVLGLIDMAIAAGDVAGTLDRLAPASGDYAVLRATLKAMAPDDPHRAVIAANMERWRWLPRDLGPRYLFVNIPQYTAWLVEDGRIAATHRVIVGKIGTPTPQFAATVRGVILNPVWNVPTSIVAESVGALVRRHPDKARARGYDWSDSADGLKVRQMPGPDNALGQVKLDMPNAWSIYLHDTPAKALFDKPVRTFSHGCVRTEGIADLAADLLDGTGWTAAAVADAIAAGETQSVPLARPIPVYIVYFTVRADKAGALRYLGDPYKRDAAMAADASASVESECSLG